MVKEHVLIGLIVVLVLGYGVLEQTKTIERDALYNVKVEASEHLQQLFERVKAYRIEIDGSIDESIDVNETGMIGPRFSSITTTLGALESKRTSANPNMAALVVHLISEAGVRRGDTIAVNMSGSFPALNLAVISAAEAMGLEAVLMSSIGASTYGANHEALTYLDMEQRLFEEGLISTRSIAFSNGGADDLGLDMDQAALDRIQKRHGDKTFIEIEDYEENIAYRMALYDCYGENVPLFINVGGNLVSGGDSDVGFGIDNGLINPNIKMNYSDHGLIGAFLERGVCVIHLLDIKDLALEYGISIDPVPLSAISDEDIYYSYRYNRTVLNILLLVGAGGFCLYGYIRKSEIDEALRQVRT